MLFLRYYGSIFDDSRFPAFTAGKSVLHTLKSKLRAERCTALHVTLGNPPPLVISNIKTIAGLMHTAANWGLLFVKFRLEPFPCAGIFCTRKNLEAQSLIFAFIVWKQTKHFCDHLGNIGGFFTIR